MIAASDRIGIGIIGASAQRGWAKVAHLPAIALNPGFRLAAVATSNSRSAREAADAYDIDLAFDDHRAMVARPEVDLVVVAVKTPHHRELVSDALAAGKHVYCEWPLGRTLGEAVELAELARARQLHAVIGLQARSSPAIRHLRHLHAQRQAGDLLGVAMRGRVPAFGAVTDQANAYINDSASGASLLSISFAHSLDALCWSLGELTEVSATLAIRQPRIKVSDTGEMIERTSPDQVLITGRLEGGAPVSVHFQGGSSPLGNFDWEIVGSDRHFAVTAATGNLQIDRSELYSASAQGDAVETWATPDAFCPIPSAPPGPAYNMTQVYARLYEELRGTAAGDDRLPDFAAAVERHRTIAAIEQAALTGQRQSIA